MFWHFAACLCLPAAAVGADELTVGPWTITYGPTGVRGVALDGKPLLGPLDVNLYAPDYARAHFGLGGCEVRQETAGEARRLVFTCEKAGAAKCVGTLEIEGERLRWTAAVEMSAEGPLEVHVPILAAAFETGAGDVFFTIDRREEEVPRGRTWPPYYPQEQVRLRGFDSDLVLRPTPGQGRWVFQDRRASEPPCARIIGLARSTGEGVTAVSPGIDIIAESLPQEEAHARRLVLGQQRVTERGMPVTNPGFEAGDLSGWHHGANARLDEDDPSEGQACARLEVAAADEQSVYLTQSVPVTPGARYQASCRLRTEDVQAAPGMRMASVGAALIHEWADRDGKWKYAGSYSDGTFGTSGWQTVECEELIAPEDAGYAIIYLALRATGTAWFDEVRLTEVKRHTVVTAPLDGASLRDNRPLFTWLPVPEASRYRIECRAPNGGFEATTEDPRYRPPEPLPPGEYEWQVTAASAEPSVAWRFAQTAPQEADTTGPDVTLPPQNRAPRGGLWVQATDVSGVDWAKTRLRLDGQDTPVTPHVDGDLASLQLAGDWPTGGIKVEVAVLDKSGNEARAESWVVNTPAPAKPLTWTVDRGVSDGERCFLPLGMYQVPIAEMPRVKQAGFNAVHLYTWEGSKDDVTAREYLDAAHKHGLRVFIGFDRGNSSGSGLVQMNLDHVARRIGALRDHPALLAWYLFDEPDLSHQYVTPTNLRKLYEFIRTLDPYHPVIVTFAGDNPLTVYPQCYDVHWTQVYGATEHVRARLLKHREMLPEASLPLMAILHCYDREQSAEMKAGATPDPARFYLTPEKLRADIAMALALQSSGLAWWWYGDGGKQWLTVADLPEAWAGMAAAVREVREIEPLLTGTGEELSVELQTDPAEARVVARARRVGGRILLIVCSSEEEREVRFTLKAEGLGGRGAVLFEGREMPAADEAIQDTLSPLGRRYYEFRGR
ncbi:MAG: hypothetical protein FJX74_11130 [Armatimonadetes bacterium]|nr:hypothetical protein [Armatimonadota bacterium]